MANTWGERRSFHPTDETLRRHGFRIVSRPKDGEAIWGKEGHKYTVEQAKRLIEASMRDLEAVGCGGK